METKNELLKNCSETENIYSDIIEFDLGTEVEKLKEENGLLEDHIDSLKQDIEKLAEALQQLKVIQKNLAENISSLFLTAKMELSRKDRIIDNLQRELNDIIFRRDKKKRKPLCTSPVNLSKRGRYDNSYNSTDQKNNYIDENNHNYNRCHSDENSEKVVRDNELKNEVGWGPREKYRQYDNDVHEEYKNTAKFQPKSYGQNIDDRVKLQYRQDTRSSNHDRNHSGERNHSRDRNDDSYRTRRYLLNTPSTDHKEHSVDESNRKSNLKTETEEEFGKRSSDNEQNLQNECSRIPKVETTIKLEREPIMEKTNKSNTEKRKPVRKKLLVLQKLERELMEKRALESQNPSVALSRDKTKSNKNSRGNYFVDHMDHIMDTVLLNINEAKIITISKKERNLNDKPLTGHCSSHSEDEKNLTMNAHNQLSSLGNVNTISHNLASELTDIKKEREIEKCDPCDDVNYNSPSSKKDSETVSETIKRTLNENNIKKDDEKIYVNNDIVSLNELPAQSGHEEIKNSYLLRRKSDQVIEDELNFHIENVTKLEDDDFEIGEEGTKQENWKNQYQMNSSTSEMKIGQKLSQISNRETLQININECLNKTNSSESLCDSRSERHHENNEGPDISRTSKFTKAVNDKYVKSQKNQQNEVKYTSKDNVTTRNTPDMGVKQEKQSTHNNTESKIGISLKCILNESQETNPLRKRRRKMTPPTLPKLNSQYKIPKKVKKILESEPSEKNDEYSKPSRNLVLISMEDQKISYERKHKDIDRENDNIRKSRRKSVPRSFRRQKIEETQENIRSKSRERLDSRDNNCEGQTETGGQHHRGIISTTRYRIDYRRDHYTRIKNFNRESLKGQEGRSRNREEEKINSDKNNTMDMKHSRMEKINDSYLDTDPSELTAIKTSLCSQKGREKSYYSVIKDTERIHKNIFIKDHQTIEKDLDTDTIHQKNEYITEHKELPTEITETKMTATEMNYSVEKEEASGEQISKETDYGESPKKNPAEQEHIATKNGNYDKIPDSFTEMNMQNTDSKIIEGKFSSGNVATSIKDSLNEQKNGTTDGSDNTNVKKPLEKVNSTDSLNEILLKPVSSNIKNDVKIDSKKEKLGDSAENSFQQKNRESGKLPIGNISKYSLEINSANDSKEVKTVPSGKERELKATENTKRRNMPDIFSQEVCGQIVPNLIPSKETLPIDQDLGDHITTEKIKVPDKDTIHYNSVRKELVNNKVEQMTEEKEKHLPPSETDSLKVLSKSEDSLEILGTTENSKKGENVSNLISPSSSEVNIYDSNIPVVSERSSYQKTIESSPLPAQILVRKRITPIRVDDTPLCSFENILVKNRMPSFAKDLTATNNSPLSLTHEGDIPLLHLEENFHISNDEGTQKSFDRNIMNLLDTMNMSNLECDMTKFQDSSEKGDGPRSESEPNDKSDNAEVLEPSIEQQTMEPVVISTPSTEPLVISTPVDTNDCKNKSGNGTQNSGGDLGTPIPNSGQNSSMIGRRRSVRLVVVNSV